MKTKKIGIGLGILTVALITFLACQKKSTGTSKEESASLQSDKASVQIKQKFYKISTNQTTEVIMRFKGITKGSSNESSLKITNDNVASTDSAIWLMEAALNFDFDKQPQGGTQYLVDSLFVQTNGNAQTISSTDLQNAYSNIHNTLVQKTSLMNKVKVVDITACQNSNGVLFKAYVCLFVSDNDGVNHRPSCALPSDASWGRSCVVNCTPADPDDAPGVMNTYLNCGMTGDYGLTCSCGAYLTNVVTNTYVGNSSNGLYHNSGNSFCDNTVLSQSAMYGYTSAATSIATTDCPSGSIVTNYNYSCFFSFIINNSWIDYHVLAITFATPHCNTNC